MQQLELIILFHCLHIGKYNALYNSVCYEYNEMSNMRNDIYNISIDDVRVAIKH